MENDEQVISGITMPPLYNKRAGHMWDIISQHVDFKGKRVVDLGCGHGDLLVRAYAAGAQAVYGIDIDTECINNTSEKFSSVKRQEFWLGIDMNSPESRSVELWQGDLENGLNESYDIAICCSVLPYLRNKLSVLKEMRAHAPLSIIEAQYYGDGPGPEGWKDDEWMSESLYSVGWLTVTPIGKTFVEGRNKWRTIWKCEQ